jgi:hypothetical protein
MKGFVIGKDLKTSSYDSQIANSEEPLYHAEIGIGELFD